MARIMCAWYCGLLLWLSGIQHLANSFYFFGNVLDYNLVSPGVAAIVASSFPWLHLLLVATLIAPRLHSRTPFLATMILGTVFVVVQVGALIAGNPVDCGCFGGMSERNVGPLSLILAVSLIIVAGFGARHTPLAGAGKSSFAWHGGAGGS